ncbi:MAG: 5-oxoprolinase subunit PxpA [Pararhodobacter sp.]
MQSVDINCDLGEGFGRWRIGEVPDAQLMPLITSANIAAGFHAGDPNIIDETVALAIEHGVSIGAHMGYNDVQGFGRRSVKGSVAELVNDLVYQVGAVAGFARRHGAPMRHVKPHGAIYMDLAARDDLSEAFIAYMRAAEPEAFVYCMPGFSTHRAAIAAGQPAVREFYADRDYDDNGSIVFVRDAGHYQPGAIAQKCLRACTEGKVQTVTGKDIDIAFDSICVHSDTPGALAILDAMHEALQGAGIRIAAPSRS